MSTGILGAGVTYFAEYWDIAAQKRVCDAIADIVSAAPFFRPIMPRTGKPWSIYMTNAGPLGWVSDRSGYRYQATHPETGAPWPPLFPDLSAAWQALTGRDDAPECCLINYYHQPQSKMGLHQDRDEEDFTAPIVSFSLGDSAVFRMGGPNRRGPTRSIRLHSGDALMFGGPSRMAFHGIDRVLSGSSQLLSRHPGFGDGGRINLTLRRVSAPPAPPKSL